LKRGDTAPSARRRIGLLTLLAATLAASSGCGGSAAAIAPAGAGVYVGPADPAGVTQFQQWSKENISYVLEFTDRETWAKISNPWFLSGAWNSDAKSFRTQVLVLSVPMLPGNGGSLGWGAHGLYNWHFRQLAQQIRSNGLASRTIIRLGWEFNSGWASWSAADDPAAFAEYFRQVVTTMRAVAPGIRFDWCPAEGAGQFYSVPNGLAAAYPGDAYVDYIGMDVYDQAWGTNGGILTDPAERWSRIVNERDGLAWQAAFAAAHGKPLSFPEWALTQRDDGHGGGDDPYFIRAMHDWIASHNVGYQIYFDADAPDGLHDLESSRFPSSATAFKQLFGATAS
jgi:Glycosyl hydrolase family 26